MNRYTGKRMHNGCVVTVNQQPLPLCIDTVNCSPSGFEWKSCPSGAYQLTFAILHHHSAGDSEQAFRAYQNFKENCLSIIEDSEWIITSNDIDTFLNVNSIYEDQTAHVNFN